MNLDKRYLVWALSYATVGLALGIYMAASQNHAELVTHTHILLIGFVLSFVYGIIHKLWLQNPHPSLAKVQFVVHQAGAITICVALFLLYGNLVPAATLDPILGTSAAGILLAMLLMLYMVIRSGTEKAPA
jgi:putative solute:sodium symporter small subunit